MEHYYFLVDDDRTNTLVAEVEQKLAKCIARRQEVLTELNADYFYDTYGSLAPYGVFTRGDKIIKGVRPHNSRVIVGGRARRSFVPDMRSRQGKKIRELLDSAPSLDVSTSLLRSILAWYPEKFDGTDIGFFTYSCTAGVEQGRVVIAMPAERRDSTGLHRVILSELPAAFTRLRESEFIAITKEKVSILKVLDRRWSGVTVPAFSSPSKTFVDQLGALLPGNQSQSHNALRLIEEAVDRHLEHMAQVTEKQFEMACSGAMREQYSNEIPRE